MESAAEILKKSLSNKSLNISETSSNAEESSPTTTPLCPQCDGMGFVVPNLPPGTPGFGRAVPCMCRVANQEVTQRQTLLNQSQIGALTHCTFESFVPEGIGLNVVKQRNLKLAYDTALAYAQEPDGWLLLKGGYGSGKTHLAAAIANYQLAQGKPALFINTPDLLDHLRATFGPTAGVGYDERFAQVRNAPLLILDDLGAHSQTEWAQEKLYQIFNHRYNTRLPTVITTNEDIESIEVRIQSRMVDSNLVKSVFVAAPDFRRIHSVHQDQSDLSTLHLHTDKTFTTFQLRAQELPRGQADNLRRAIETAQQYAASPADWLVFNSVTFGNGKTHLAAAVANDIAQHGEQVLFVLVPDLLDYLRASFNPQTRTRYDKRFDEIKTAPFLVLDDLGTESATNWAREKLYQLFNYRYNARLPTIITTATRIEELDPRLATRMLDDRRCTFFVLEVPSFRGQLRSKKGRSKRNSA